MEKKNSSTDDKSKKDLRYIFKNLNINIIY